MNEVIAVLKSVTLLGGGGVVGGLLATWKLKADMVTKEECRFSADKCSGRIHEALAELKTLIEDIRKDVYVIRGMNANGQSNNRST